MADNQQLLLTDVTPFLEDAKQRGIYTSSQDSMVASWKIFLSTILPTVGLDPEKIRVGEARQKLSEWMQRYGAKNGVKVASVTTYQTKVRRLLNEFVEYHGGDEAKWYAWKQQSERRSSQASAAAASKAKKPHRKEESPPSSDVGTAGAQGEAPTGPVHLLPLPGGKRHAELRLPSDLRLADFPLLKKTFDLIMLIEQNRVEVTTAADDAQPAT